MERLYCVGDKGKCRSEIAGITEQLGLALYLGESVNAEKGEESSS